MLRRRVALEITSDTLFKHFRHFDIILDQKRYFRQLFFDQKQIQMLKIGPTIDSKIRKMDSTQNFASTDDI